MREMKDSGVAWIGEIPETWETMPVKNVFEITRGRVIAKTEIEEEARENYYPVYSSQTANNGVLGYIQTFDYSVDSLTWTTDGAKAGTVFLRRGKYSITNVCGILTPKTSEQCLEFLHYTVSYSAFNCRRADINGYKIMSNEMAIIPIVLPPISTQQKIAAHLDRKCTQIDALISNAQQQIEKLKAYKQSVITETVTKGLDPDVEMKDSGVEWIGEIPEHWNVVKICRIADKTHPYSIGDGDHGLVKPDDYLDSGIPYIRVQNLGWCSELDLSNIVYISEQTNNKIKNSTLKPNDVLFAKTGATIGKTAIVPASMPISNTTSHVGKISVSPNYCAKYILYVLSSTIGYRQFWEFASAKTTRPELAIDEIRQILILLPPTKEQQAISDYLDLKCTQIDQLIALKQQKIEKLQQYKKSLIYEYVTGKKEV